MDKPILNGKVRKAIEARHSMFWQRNGTYGFELRAVTYTWENGNERTAKLDTFDLRADLERAFQVHIEICKQVSAFCAPDIVTALDSAYWDGTLARAPRVMLEEFQFAGKVM